MSYIIVYVSTIKLIALAYEIDLHTDGLPKSYDYYR